MGSKNLLCEVSYSWDQAVIWLFFWSWCKLLIGILNLPLVYVQQWLVYTYVWTNVTYTSAHRYNTFRCFYVICYSNVKLHQCCAHTVQMEQLPWVCSGPACCYCLFAFLWSTTPNHYSTSIFLFLLWKQQSWFLHPWPASMSLSSLV